MNKSKIFIAIMICALLLGGCGEILNKKEAEQLKEDAKICCEEVHKSFIQEEGYENAVLLEAFVEYTDVYDESLSSDTANVFSKYQLEDGSIIYFNNFISDMKGLGELTDKSYIFHSTEREEYYLDYKEAAETGNHRGEELKSVGDGVYVREAEESSIYYFMIDVK